MSQQSLQRWSRVLLICTVMLQLSSSDILVSTGREQRSTAQLSTIWCRLLHHQHQRCNSHSGSNPSNLSEQTPKEITRLPLEDSTRKQETPSLYHLEKAQFIESIKVSILDKLELSSRPDKHKLASMLLPHQDLLDSPLLGEELTQVEDELFEEEYHAKTESIIITAKLSESCQDLTTTACIQFPLHNDISTDLVTSAQLWVPDVIPTHSLLDHPIFTRTRNTTYKQQHWQHIELKDILKDTYNSGHHRIELALKQHSPNRVQAHMWYLQVHMSEGSHRRQRRNAEFCERGKNGGCCMEKLYVDFRSIGWSDWIVWPSGFTTNYCKGSCQVAHEHLGHNLAVHHHARVMMTMSKQSKHQNKAEELARDHMAPCCSPTKLNHLNLIYYDLQGFILRKKLPDMTVLACGCS